MKFEGLRVIKNYKQINNASPEEIFPLLCPVREKDWIDGWEYEMIYSVSERVEKGCVFSTPHHGEEHTIWYVTEHDTINFRVEFVRLTPGEEVVKINIQLTDNGDGTTTSDITYEYTGLSDNKNDWLKNSLDKAFNTNMIWWEKAINHFIKTGEKLLR